MGKDVQHSHPKRAAKAKRTAQAVAVLGILGMIAGFWYFLSTQTILGAWGIALIPLGATAILLSAIWYFSYMEQLEPELYEHDAGMTED